MHADFAANTVQTLIATIPDHRLRELVVGIFLAAVRCLTVEAAASEQAAPVRADKARRHWSQARRDAHNATRREQRKLAAASSRQRRSRKPKAETTPVSGDGNGRAVSPAALWKHAAKLSPDAPWRIVAREFGVSENVAQNAHRDGILPGTPRAAARFLTL